jgi:hypothetical protein
MSRLAALGAVSLVGVSVAVFALRCATDPAIPFLVQDARAPWIMFPLPPSGLMGLAERDALPVTHFRRSFRLDAAPARAELRLRALRGFELSVNGERVTPAEPAPRHWRTYQRVDVSRWLRAGENEIAVDVRNPTGPGMLSLRLGAGELALASGPDWTASLAGGAPAPAIAAGVDRVNPSSYAMPAPGEGLLARRNPLLALAVVSAAAFLWLRGSERWRACLLSVLPLGIGLVWTALFATSMLEIPLHVGFDAHHHVAYVDFLLARQRLPLATDGWMMFHPPGYYAPTAALVALQRALAPESDSLFAWKLPGFLAGLASALLALALARRLFGARSRETLLAALFAAALPMNLTLSSYVTNESFHAACAGAVILATAHLLLAPAPTRGGLALWSALAAVAVLTKYTAWIVVCVAGFFLLVKWLRVERAGLRDVLSRGALVTALLALLAGWWYARNAAHFGQLFPLNVDLPGETKQWWSQPGYYTPAFFLRFGSVLAHPFLAGTHTAWNSLYATLWGDGQLAGQVSAAARHGHWDWTLMAAGYWLALPATLLLCAGALASLRAALGPGAGGRRSVHAFLLTLTYALLYSVLYMTLRMQDYGQVKAFYALAALAPLSIFFALGAGAADRALEARGAGWARALLYAWLGAFLGAAWLSHAG